MRIVAGRRTKRPAGENVSLPMRLSFKACHADIKGQRHETIDGRMVVSIF